MKRIWLTWETQRRNKPLADAFGAEYLRMDHSTKSAPVRYSLCCVQTIGALISRSPKIVFAQYPSLVLCLFCLVLRPIFRYRLVVDAHNICFEQATGKGLLGFAARSILKKSDLVIASNLSLVETVKENGVEFSEVAELPDALPDIEKCDFPESLGDRPDKLVSLISTFADDEPIEEVIKAFFDFLSKNSEGEIKLFVTGRKSKAGSLLEYEGEEVQFTDYLAQEEFDGLIQSSDLIVDLTTRDDCLVCGAYEALAVQTPVLLSDTEALRSTFGDTALYTKNDSSSISSALTKFFADPNHYSTQQLQYIASFRADWQKHFENLNRKIASI